MTEVRVEAVEWKSAEAMQKLGGCQDRLQVVGGKAHIKPYKRALCLILCTVTSSTSICSPSPAAYQSPASALQELTQLMLLICWVKRSREKRFRVVDLRNGVALCVCE